ncbi:MAG: regulatory protein RecX [Armatimonadetes bacterium]|nr:regulatory protein RecX [Armatimonadota bacterium]
MSAPGTVTSIRPHPKRPSHYTVTIEGQEELVLHEDVIVAVGLTAGKQLTPDMLDRITHEDQLFRARDAALRLLKVRGRSEWELERSLARKGFSPEVVSATLAKLENLGFVDDASFARDRAQSLLRRHIGRQGLLYRLRESGVSEEVARGVVAEALEDVDDVQRATEALTKRLRRWEDLPGDKRRARAYQHLYRLGFDPDTILSALQRALADDSETEDL